MTVADVPFDTGHTDQSRLYPCTGVGKPLRIGDRTGYNEP
jgi:hypothetical protein